MTLAAIIGPPWRVINPPDAVMLAADPPVMIGCDVWAAFSPATAQLERARDETEADLRACKLAAFGNGEAWVIKGGLGLRSGRWLFLGEPRRVISQKVDTPNSRRGFARLVERLRRRLDRFAGSAERAALDEIFDDIDADWVNLTPEAIDELIGESAATMRAIGANSRFVTSARGAMSSAAVNISTGVRAAMRNRFGLPITQSMSLQDLRAIRRLGGGRVGFFTDEYGRRSRLFDRDGRRIVNRGLAQGLPPNEISRSMRDLALARATGRSAFYYQTVAGAMVSQARSFSQLTGLRDAGITSYTWEATLDERTCPVCRFLDGQVFSVSTGLQRFAQADALAQTDPEAAANVTPWYSVVRGEEGEPDQIFMRPRGEGPTIPIASILRDATGLVDERGSFRQINSVEAVGASQTPPAHGGCRCTTTPVF